jgi:hypothetical protein
MNRRNFLTSSLFCSLAVALPAHLKANGLEEGKFLCCLSRLRFTPHWSIPDKKRAFVEQRQRETMAVVRRSLQV